MNDDRARARKPPIPLTLLTGFLGAGKTTLLNRLLRDPEFVGTAVIVNEFGDIGLDHLLVEQARDGIIELSAGCVCCTIRGELVEALERLLRAIDNRRIGEVRRVVIETTGLADPAPILHVLTRHPYLGIRFNLDGIIAVVDAVHGGATLSAHEESVKQVAVADRIVLTKSDLNPDDSGGLVARLSRLNPGALILDAGKGEAAAGALIGCGPFDAQTKGADVTRWLAAEAFVEAHDHHHDVNRHDDHIATFALIRDAAMEESVLGEFLDRLAFEHAERLIRVKGLIGVADEPGRPAVIHGVQGLFSPPIRLEAWPDSDRRSRIVVIGRDLDRDAVERLFDAFVGQPRLDAPDRQALVDNPLAIPGVTAGLRR